MGWRKWDGGSMKYSELESKKKGKISRGQEPPHLHWGGLACCGSWGLKESDMTEPLN